ncbi:MAG: Por secretion system C-terminal sorting protein, partial [Ferruginibacter sp.]|nr:Por secretion system C-terminal sorting protein [Ferruginibacter sp.]
DVTKPVLGTIPTDVTVNCDAVPAAAVVSATDNCDPAPAVSLNEVSTQVGSVTAAGHYNYTITRTWTATDVAGNNISGTQVVTVHDVTKPVISNCPSNITLYTGAGRLTCDQVATWSVPTATDNCSPVTVTSNYNTGNVFPKGTTTVTYTFKDVTGNSSSCSFTVTVIDNTAPVIACKTGSPFTRTATIAPCSYKVSGYEFDATFTDNCSGGTIKNNFNNGSTLSGAILPNGSTTIVWTAADAAGNTSTCSIVVNVGTTLGVTVTNSNPQLYYGYSLDQSTIITGTPTGGTGPYKIVITMDRPLSCNVITNAGDEVWTGGAGTTTSAGTTCPASGSGSIPVSTAASVNSGSSYSVTATLIKNAVFSITITDFYGCSVNKTTTVYSEDDRCFAGNSSIVKIKLCHKTGNPNDPCHELCVDQSAVAAHLAHGDFLGACTANCVAPPRPPASRAAIPLTTTNTARELLVNVMPNPTTTFFNVIIKGRDASPVTVRVMDVYGRLIQLHEKIGAFSTLQIGDKWPGGTYFVEVLQGGERKVIKVIKAN